MKSERQKKVTPAAKKAPAARRPQNTSGAQPLRVGDKVFVIRFALTEGVLARSVEHVCRDGQAVIQGIPGTAKPGVDFARVAEDAIRLAEKKRDAEVGRLRRRLVQLEALKFRVSS